MAIGDDDFTPDALPLALATLATTACAFVAVGYGTSVQLWDVVTPSEAPTRTLEGHETQVGCVACDSQHGVVAAGAADGLVLVWSWAEGEGTLLHTLHCPDEVRCVAVAPRALLAGCDDCVARLWKLPGGSGGAGPAAPCLLKGHEDWVYSCALSSDASLAATGADDGTMRLWRLPADGAEGCECVALLPTHSGCFGCAMTAGTSPARGNCAAMLCYAGNLQPQRATRQRCRSGIFRASQMGRPRSAPRSTSASGTQSWRRRSTRHEARAVATLVAAA